MVEEVPAYAPSGEGQHLFMWIEKRGVGTFDAVSLLARALGRRDRDFGIAGLKDARAVTRQWVSIADVPAASVRGLELDGVRVLEATPHGNKLKMGHLRGNRFAILLRGTGEEHLAPAQSALDELVRRGTPNYFGEQRFGKRGANLSRGLSILHGNPRKASRSMPRRLFNLVVSAVQSEVFNRVLARRIDSYDRLELGDLAWLHRNGACFAVEDLDAEQPRCAALEVSPSGPLPGPSMTQPTHRPGELEAAVLEELELDPEVFGRMPRGTHEGARRALRVPVEDARVELAKRGLRVTFALPRGSYATSVLAELLVDRPWFGESW